MTDRCEGKAHIPGSSQCPPSMLCTPSASTPTGRRRGSLSPAGLPQQQGPPKPAQSWPHPPGATPDHTPEAAHPPPAPDEPWPVLDGSGSRSEGPQLPCWWLTAQGTECSRDLPLLRTDGGNQEGARREPGVQDGEVQGRGGEGWSPHAPAVALATSSSSGLSGLTA